MYEVKQLRVRTLAGDYSVSCWIASAGRGDLFGSVVDISPALVIGDEPIERVVCRIADEGHSALMMHMSDLSPSILTVASLLCCRRFILGNVAPMGRYDSGILQLNLGQLLVDIDMWPLPKGDELRLLLLPEGDKLLDWCELDVLCWLLGLFTESGGKPVVAAGDFLASDEMSFPYTEDNVNKALLAVHQQKMITGKTTFATRIQVIKDTLDRRQAKNRKQELADELLSPPAPQVGQQQEEAPDREYDIFICLASEDVDVAEPIYAALTEAGVKVFYYKVSIGWGDSIPKKINTGLASCRYGIPILSKAFFDKPYPKAELDALAERQNSTGQKTLLPIWHGVTKQDVMTAYPLLAPIQAVMSTESVESIVAQVLEMRPQKGED